MVLYIVQSKPIINPSVSVVVVAVCVLFTKNGPDIFTNTTASVGASRDNNQTPLGYLMGPSRVRKCSQSSLMSGTVDDNLLF